MTTPIYTESWLSGPGSTQFYTRTYTPTPEVQTKAVVVALHGFAEHVGRYTHFHPLFAEKGIAIFAYDQRGFGLTAQDTTSKKSKDSSYGKTSWKAQMADIAWAVGHAKKTFEGVPLFLMGHSMGGAEVIGFATLGNKYKSTLESISGVIATSPLIQQTTPAPKALKWAGGKLSAILPNLVIPAEVKAEHLSHDSEVNNATLKDPLMKQAGSLKGIHDMLTNGELLLTESVRHWPKALPVIILHGTDDKITSHKASQKFHDDIVADKKKHVPFLGGYHELHNEPQGVKEKLANEIVLFIEEHITPSSTAPVATVVTVIEEAAETPEDADSKVPKPAEPEPEPEPEPVSADTGINKAKM